MGKYTDALVALLPPGPAWNRESTSVLYKLLDALAQEFQRVEDMALELIEEMDPRTTDGLLDDWERVAGLPGTCWTPTTDDERRTALHAKLTTRGSQREQFYLDQADTIGYLVAIARHPYSPFAAGSLCGTPIYGNEWRFVWRVYAIEGTEDDHLMCVFRQWTQAHTAVEFYWIDLATWTARTAAGAYAGTFYCGSWALQGKWNDAIVVAGSGGEIQASFDKGETWTAMSAAGAYAGTFYSTFGNEVGCVLGGSGGEIQISGDAVTWLSIAAAGGYTGDFRGIAQGAGLYVLVGSGGEIQTSVTGIGWVARTAAASYSGTFYGVAYGNSTFAAVGQSGEIQTSSDGITWTRRNNGGAYFYGVAWNGTVFVAVTSTNKAWVSSNGITWVDYSITTGGGNVNSVSAHRGGVLVATEGSVAAEIMISKDNGQTWVAQATASMASPSAAVWSDARCITVGGLGAIETSDLTEDLSA